MASEPFVAGVRLQDVVVEPKLAGGQLVVKVAQTGSTRMASGWAVRSGWVGHCGNERIGLGLGLGFLAGGQAGGDECRGAGRAALAARFGFTTI